MHSAVTRHSCGLHRDAGHAVVRVDGWGGAPLLGYPFYPMHISHGLLTQTLDGLGVSSPLRLAGDGRLQEVETTPSQHSRSWQDPEGSQPHSSTCGLHDPVRQGMTAPVDIAELGLGHAAVHVDGVPALAISFGRCTPVVLALLTHTLDGPGVSRSRKHRTFEGPPGKLRRPSDWCILR